MSREVRRDSLRTPENVKVTLQCLQGKGLGIDPGALVAKSGDLFYGALNTRSMAASALASLRGRRWILRASMSSPSRRMSVCGLMSPLGRLVGPLLGLASRPPTFRRDAAGKSLLEALVGI